MKDDKPCFKVGDRLKVIFHGGLSGWHSEGSIVTVKSVDSVGCPTSFEEQGEGVFDYSVFWYEHASPCVETAVRKLEKRAAYAMMYGAGPNTIKSIKEEITMTKLIETRTFIRGHEESDVDDDRVFTYIAEEEAKMAKLKEINNQPQSLKDKITAMGKEIAELVAFVDKRNNL